MFDIVEPYSGHHFTADYIEYDEKNKTYKPPRPIRIKGFAGIGISSGVREDIRIKVDNRWVIKSTLKIHVVESLDYKPKDRIRTNHDEKTYNVYKVGDDFNHVNAMVNQMFPRMNKRPHVLYLGDD